MADVKWIKITTDIFDDEKVLLIESLPDADSIIVIWFKLLCLAGKQNNSGVFILGDKIPYTDKMLATIFRRKESTVKLALDTFEQFGMISIIDGVITIPNWNKHQQLDILEKNRDYMREYMRERRNEQKEIACKVNSKPNSKVNSKSNSKPNVKPPDKNKNKNKNKNKIENKSVDKIAFGENKNVLLTEQEHERLIERYGQDITDKCIELLDDYIEEKPNYKSNSHCSAIHRWVVNAVNERDDRSRKSATSSQTNRSGDNIFLRMAQEEGIV